MALRSRDASGFTMVELLATIAIMGILAGIATLGVAQFRKNATDQACASDVDQVKVAASAFIAKQGPPIGGATSMDRMRTLADGSYLQGIPGAADKIELESNGKVTDTCPQGS